MDDILDDEFFGGSLEDEFSTKVDKESKKESLINKIEESDIEIYLPKVMGDNVPIEFQSLVDKWLAVYKRLPPLDYDKIQKELPELSVKSTPTSSLQMINQQLQRVQACKDRLAEIYQNVNFCYTFKKRAVNVLSDSWGRFASGSSADKRKSDCAYRLSDFSKDLAFIESLQNVCDHILKNLDSVNNNLSRQITIIQSQLKLMDIGRGALPDFDFNKNRMNNDAFDDIGEKIEDKDDVLEGENGSRDAEEYTF
jgi:hypothetical protein